MSHYLQFLANVGIGGAHPGGLPLTKALLENEKLDSSMNVLDLGCGTGQTAAFIAKQYRCNVTGLDIEKKMLLKAEERFKKERLSIDLVESGAEQLPFQRQTFDIVLAESVIAFTDVKKTLSECFRVLKSQGRLIMIEMTKETENTLTDKEEKQIKSFYGVTKIVTEQQWCAMMKEVGFESVKMINMGESYGKRGLEEVSEIKLSPDFDLDAFRVWLEHQELMAQLRKRLTYRVYKATKNN